VSKNGLFEPLIYHWDRFSSGWWTATPADGSVGFGYGTTTDGLHWTTEPPAKVNLHGKKNGVSVHF
jgi:hypothetical protein